MKITFHEKVINKYKQFVRKHYHLRYLGFLVAAFFLFWDEVRKHLVYNCKRYFAIAFSLMFCFLSCSFSNAVFATEYVNSVNYKVPNEKTIVSKATFAEEGFSVEEMEDATPMNSEKSDTQNGDEIDDLEDDYENMELLDTENTYSFDDLMEVASEIETFEEENQNKYEFDQNDWKLVLINKQHPIAADYELHLGQIKGSMQCDERIIPELRKMLQAAKTDGVNLVICSPYRNMDRQVALFEKKINMYTGMGMSYMDAYKTASQAVTVPGASEHQVGLALDIISDRYSALNEGFGETDAGKWLAEHSHEYGFILRYPAGKEMVTSIEYEPWHFRYVGKECAQVIHDEKICLEEFWEKYL